MNERLRELRKALNLTLERFGARIGVGKSSISDIERGSRNLTDHMFLSICREFSVNPDWLRDGVGDMFVEDDSRYASMIDQIMQGENAFAKNIFKTFASLSESDWEALEHLVNTYTDIASSGDEVPDTPEELEAMFPPVPDSDAKIG